jgi:DNA-binding NtrC family response regulator
LASLPADLLESELFGFEKGSFTNADHQKKGMFELADSGSIFLDDIDDTPLGTQAKLLRVLESNEVRHIGGTKPIPVDVRLISASKVEIKDLVVQNVFRQDLYYRINIVQLRIPPLRERKDDIPLLIEHFIKRLSPDKNLKISEAVLDILMDYSWPGNVRELRNVVQRASLFAEGEIKITDLPEDYRQLDHLEQMVKACKACFNGGKMSYNAVIQCLENRLLNEALSSTDGNQSEAARKLGMKLSTFRDKMKKLDACQQTQ